MIAAYSTHLYPNLGLRVLRHVRFLFGMEGGARVFACVWRAGPETLVRLILEELNIECALTSLFPKSPYILQSSVLKTCRIDVRQPCCSKARVAWQRGSSI